MPESRHRRRRGHALSRSARSAGSLAAARPRRKKMNKLYFAASALIAVLVIAGFAVSGLSSGGSTSFETGRHDEYQQGIGVQQEPMHVGPDGLNFHVATGQTVDYNTVPPTSGDHWATPTACGFYEEGISDETIVHNLEHGNIVVSYNLTDPAQVEQLQGVIDGIDHAADWAVTRFYDQIPAGQVAVATWGVLDLMDGIDPDRIRTFFESYFGNLGPEQVPCAGLPRQHNR